jgi:hypothetical protein
MCEPVNMKVFALRVNSNPLTFAKVRLGVDVDEAFEMDLMKKKKEKQK